MKYCNVTVEQLQQTKAYMEKQLNGFKKEIEWLPEGQLQVKKNGKYKSLYRVTRIDGKRIETGIGGSKIENKRVVEVLRRRWCVEKSISILEKDIKILEHLLKNYSTFSPHNIVEKMPEAYKLEPWEFVATPQKEHAINSKEAYAKGDCVDRIIHKTGKECNLKFEMEQTLGRVMVDNEKVTLRSGANIDTGLGIKVRSKSEMLIAITLWQHGITYFYEVPILLDKHLIYPDFILLDSAGRIMVWEHFGLIDDLKYAKKSGEKLMSYGKNGFVPYENLIITTETKETPLDASIVLRVVETQIL